jgi:hypothetical protein
MATPQGVRQDDSLRTCLINLFWEYDKIVIKFYMLGLYALQGYLYFNIHHLFFKDIYQLCKLHEHMP